MSVKTVSQQKLSKAVYNKTSALAYSQGSVSFTATGRLTVADNTALNMGTGDFTWECWFNTANTTGVKVLMYKGQSTGGAGGAGAATTGIVLVGNQIVWPGSTEYTSSGTWTANTWNHIAITRTSGTLKMWLNGAASGSFSDSVDYTTTSATLALGDRVASHPLGQYPYTGYISNARIVKGTAVYTAAFTTPTSPLTAISGTSLLTCQDAGQIIDRSSNAFSITTTGTASASSTKPFA